MITFKSRRDMVRALIPSGSVVAELGVLSGTFSKEILTTCPHKLHLVDLWQEPMITEEDGVLMEHEPRDSLMKVYDRFKKNIQAGQIEIHICDAIEFLKNNKLDACYIDDLHTYEHLLQELTICQAPLIFVHDYCEAFPQIIKAVNDFVTISNYKIIGITDEDKNIVYPREPFMPEFVAYNSIALRKSL